MERRLPRAPLATANVTAGCAGGRFHLQGRPTDFCPNMDTGCGGAGRCRDTGEKGKRTRQHHNGSLAVALTTFMPPSYCMLHTPAQEYTAWAPKTLRFGFRLTEDTQRCTCTLLRSCWAEGRADLTQTHHSNSSTFGLSCAENHRRAQSFLYLWS